MPKSISARIFVALIVVSGLFLLVEAVLNAHAIAAGRFIAFAILAVVAARLKVKLPGLSGIMSVNLPFILLAAALLGTAEAAMIGFISTFAQSLPSGKQKFNPVQLVFNCCAITLAVSAARMIYTSAEVTSLVSTPPLRLAVAASGFYLVNTVTVAMVISLTEKLNLVRTWAEMFQLSFTYLVASVGLAGLALTVGHEGGWQVPLAMLPVMIGVFYSYRRYFAVTVSEAVRGEQMDAARVAAGVHA